MLSLHGDTSYNSSVSLNKLIYSVDNFSSMYLYCCITLPLNNKNTETPEKRECFMTKNTVKLI